MKASLAVLADLDTYNSVRRLAWRMHTQFGITALHAHLPPHVSLKQPFSVPSAEALERYVDALATEIQPFVVHLTALALRAIAREGAEYGLLWFDVEESTTLRGLHERLNDELERLFGNTQAPFDGDEYLFHMTVAMGGQPPALYQQFLNSVGAAKMDSYFMARHLAVFVYDEPMGPAGEYLTYKIIPLSGKA